MSVVCDPVCSVFVDLAQAQTSRFTPLWDVICCLVVSRPFDSRAVLYKWEYGHEITKLCFSQKIFTPVVKGLPNVMKWLTSWLPGHEIENISSLDKKRFADHMGKRFLESSLCILPQNRWLPDQGSAISLDLARVENMLIQACLRCV